MMIKELFSIAILSLSTAHALAAGSKNGALQCSLKSETTKDLKLTNQSTSEAMNAIGKKFYEVGVKCPERIWKGFNLENKLIVIRENGKAPFVWVANKRDFKVRSSTSESLLQNQQLMNGRFGFSKVGLCETMSVQYIDDSLAKRKTFKNEHTFMLAMHEGFHGFEQHAKSWPKERSESNRATEYPFDKTPALYRDMIIQNLFKALASSETDLAQRESYLDQAAYWNLKFKNEFPQIAKAIKAYDISEGTARYVEGRALAISRLGCSATEAEIMDEHLDIIAAQYWRSIEIADQSYSLGSVSLPLLAESTVKNWQEQVMDGNPPVDVLLQSRTAKAEEPNLKTLDAMTQLEENENKAISSHIDPAIEELKSENYKLLSLSSELMVGSYLTLGHYRVKEYPEYVFLPEFSVTYKSGDNTLVIKNASALRTKDNVCGTGQYLFPVYLSLVKSNGSELFFNGTNFKGKLIVKPSSDPKVFCAQ